MENLLTFYFNGRPWQARLYLSLQEDGSYLFTVLQDQELIDRYGQDIDFETDTDRVLQKSVVSEDLLQLQTAILHAAKYLLEFQRQKAKLNKRNL